MRAVRAYNARMTESVRKVWTQKISDDEVRAMRADREAGMTVAEVFGKHGPRLGISYEWVKRILSDKFVRAKAR